MFVLLKDNYTLALQLNVTGEHKGKHTFQGETADDTGITSVFLGPKISFTWSEKLSAEVGVDIPVSIDNTTLQAVPNYRIRAGLVWHI